MKPKFKFTKEMFHNGDLHVHECAQKALDAYLETCPRVYGYQPSEGQWVMDTFNDDKPAHTAILFDIQPIEKKKCENHIPKILSERPGHNVISNECVNCGAKLKAYWKEVEDAP
jgi:hypothetical protein